MAHKRLKFCKLSKRTGSIMDPVRCYKALVVNYFCHTD